MRIKILFEMHPHRELSPREPKTLEPKVMETRVPTGVGVARAQTDSK